MVKNIVALGALRAATNIFPDETFNQTISVALKSKCSMIEINKEAFKQGFSAVKEKYNL
jgi:2-oxoisovalerate ferredoxin oxidoreductase beta subunit